MRRVMGRAGQAGRRLTGIVMLAQQQNMRLATRDVVLLLALLPRERQIARLELAHEELERRRVERERLAGQQGPHRGILGSGRLGRRQVGA